MDYLQIASNVFIFLVILFVAFLTFTARDTRRANSVLLLGLSALLLSRLLVNHLASVLFAVVAAVLIAVFMIMGLRSIYSSRRSRA